MITPDAQFGMDVLRKDVAAMRWCENASTLMEKKWRYVKVPQKEYEALRPSRLVELAALQPASLF